MACDGHDPDRIAAALAEAKADPRPSMIACRTVIGFGAPNKQGSHDVHGAPLGDAEIAAARARLGWDHAPFEIPEDVHAAWARVAARGARAHADWQARLDASAKADDLRAHLAQDTAPLGPAMAEHKARLLADKPKLATRKASEMALEVVNAALPFTIGGSADLTGSNLTRTKGQTPVTPGDFGGSYIHYGVREHGMAAAMNGIALAGLFRPYGGTFLAFADYCRPAIRLAALMGVPSVFVMTHDSIGLGEDGPTHQPVEILASLRAIPNLTVLRPADAVETAEAWEIAIATTDRPVLMALSRQGLPTMRDAAGENMTAKGAYLLRDVAERQVTLIATGSEVEIADRPLPTALAAEGIRAAVVSAPSFERFRRSARGLSPRGAGHRYPRIGIEAAIRQGWDAVLRQKDAFVGMTGFGASAPAPALYAQFGHHRRRRLPKKRNR